MFDFSVFRIRAFSGALIGSAAMNFSFWPFMIYLPIYFQAGSAMTACAGLALLAYTLPTLVVPPLAERLCCVTGRAWSSLPACSRSELGFIADEDRQQARMRAG
jgi:hypothetical protein